MPEHNQTVLIKGGLVGKERDTNLILATESSRMKNCMLFEDYIGKRPGRIDYGNMSGIVMGYYHFETGDTNRVLGFTNSKVYRRNQTGWADITGSNLTGTVDDYVDMCTAYDDTSGEFWTVFTNNKDKIRYYDGSNDTADLSAWTDWRAKFVRYYNGYLLVGNVLYGGTRYGFRCQCSDTDKPNDTTGTNARTFNLTKDRNMSDIMRIEYFGNYLSVYKTDCVYGMWLGSTLNIFEFDVWIHQTGLRASRALCVGPRGEHFFLGYDDFYYWANRSVLPQGLANKKVKKRIFEDTDPGALQRSIAVYDQRHNKIKLYVAESFYPATIYELDLNEKQWSWWESERSNITAVGTFLPQNLVTIDELSGTIDDLEGTIDGLSGALTDNFPIVVEGNNSGESVYENDDTYSDNGTAIDFEYETGDKIFQNSSGIPFTHERVQGLRVEAKGKQTSGDRLYFYYSTDEGETFTQVTTGIDSSGTEWTDYIELTDEWAWYEIFFDVVCTQIRYKFANAIDNSTCYIRKLDEYSKERSER